MSWWARESPSGQEAPPSETSLGFNYRKIKDSIDTINTFFKLAMYRVTASVDKLLKTHLIHKLILSLLYCIFVVHES